MEMQLSLKETHNHCEPKTMFSDKRNRELGGLWVSVQYETGTLFLLLHRMSYNKRDWDIIKSRTWHIRND